ncbi:nucleotidyl transferase AbiEii/AbiGii toxin family protein [Haloferula sp. A504]|uniref:nucleotidyl transferase AbiEii/AbiGii toxin family protein n=1 Tax=Haloferula sp. A504 TaxID=3373601 RepID=UPI0031CB0570|nr:nucleotidyl transferase AbiEii/AbiGii toxin family protein [Verrucomicrobiaceae bacterium E54]
MNAVLRDMLDAYQPKTPTDYQNAAREVVQEIALLGLWRGGFFDHAAFYGGTALRIFHGLRRFSEDLDFTLLDEGDGSRLDRFLPAVATELESWGFTFEAEPKSSGEATGIESAFLKGNTQLNLLHIGAPADLADRLPKNQTLRIKLEMDLQPPPHATTEVRTQLLPSPYQVTVYDLGSLFAGKLHAVLCRGWKQRVKGRDFYDLVWYASRKVQPNLKHLDARMRQSGHWDGALIDGETLRRLLLQRFEKVDFKQAAEEVRVFLPDPRETDLWSLDFFNDLTRRMNVG